MEVSRDLLKESECDVDSTTEDSPVKTVAVISRCHVDSDCCKTYAMCRLTRNSLLSISTLNHAELHDRK